MTKAEYDSKLRLLNDEIRSLKDTYIEEHKPCELGAIIEIESQYYKKKMRGICTHFTVEGLSSDSIGNNGVRAHFKKVKKDGTPGDVLYIWDADQDKITFIH